jgi:hypothetical protein
LKKEHKRTLIFLVLFTVSYGSGKAIFWDGPESSGHIMYQGFPFPYIIDSSDGGLFPLRNAVNIALNLTLYVLIAEIAVYRFERLNRTRT